MLPLGLFPTRVPCTLNPVNETWTVGVYLTTKTLNVYLKARSE